MVDVKTLGTKAFQNYYEKLRKHDWYWTTSSDYHVYSSGLTNEKKLREQAESKGGVYLRAYLTFDAKRNKGEEKIDEFLYQDFVKTTQPTQKEEVKTSMKDEEKQEDVFPGFVTKKQKSNKVNKKELEEKGKASLKSTIKKPDFFKTKK